MLDSRIYPVYHPPMTPNTPPPSRRAPRAPLPPLDPVRASYLVQLAAALDADPLLDAHVLRLACARRQRKTARSIMPESRKNSARTAANARWNSRENAVATNESDG